MRRIILFTISLAFIAAYCDRSPTVSYSRMESNAEQVMGVIEIVTGDKRDDCQVVAKKRIIDKMLYTGFEGTSYHRPRLEDHTLVPDRILDRLYTLVYLKKRRSGEPEKCTFDFTLNIRPAIRILENENIITDFGV